THAPEPGPGARTEGPRSRRRPRGRGSRALFAWEEHPSSRRHPPAARVLAVRAARHRRDRSLPDRAANGSLEAHGSGRRETRTDSRAGGPGAAELDRGGPEPAPAGGVRLRPLPAGVVPALRPARAAPLREPVRRLGAGRRQDVRLDARVVAPRDRIGHQPLLLPRHLVPRRDRPGLAHRHPRAEPRDGAGDRRARTHRGRERADRSVTGARGPRRLPARQAPDVPLLGVVRRRVAVRVRHVRDRPAPRTHQPVSGVRRAARRLPVRATPGGLDRQEGVRLAVRAGAARAVLDLQRGVRDRDCVRRPRAGRRVPARVARGPAGARPDGEGGRRGVRDRGRRAVSADLLSYVVPPTTVLIGASRFESLNRHLASNASEDGAYLGPALIGLVVTLALAARHDRSIRLLLLFAAVVALASLGPELHVDGRAILPLPWAIAAHVPLLRFALPQRFT